MRILPAEGVGRRLALAQLANALGDGAYLVSSALYFSRIVGLSPTQIGFGLTFGWAIGSVVGVPLGHLADRRGPKGVSVLLAIATALAAAMFLFISSFPMFVLAIVLYACSQAGLAAARQALLAGLVDKAKRTEIRAYLQSTVNAGLAVGAALGGVALTFDTREAYLAVFVLDTIGFLAAAVVLRGLPSVPPAPPVAGEPKLAVLRDRPYALIAFLNTIMLIYMPLLSVIVPLWIVQRTSAPHPMVATLLVLNTVSVVLFQVRVARRVTGLESAARLVRYAGLVMFGSCAVFALSGLGSSMWVAAIALLVAAALQVVGEMMLASGAWEISFDLAPADKQGQYQGFFGTGVAVARMCGPLLLTALIINWGTPGWFVLGGLFVAAGAAMGPAVAWARRTRVAAAEAV